RAGEDQAGPQLPVAGPPNALVEPANLDESRAPDRCVPEHEVALEDGFALVRRLEGIRVVVEPTKDLPMRRDPGIGRQHIDVGTYDGNIAERFEALRGKHVVCSDEANVV